MGIGKDVFKIRLNHIKASMNIFLVILIAVMSYFIADKGFQKLKFHSLKISISVKEDPMRPFVPDCLGFRGGVIDGEWTDPEVFYKEGNWKYQDRIYHVVENEPLVLSIDCKESVALVFNSGPTQGTAQIEALGQTFYFDCNSDDPDQLDAGYTLPITQEQIRFAYWKMFFACCSIAVFIFVVLVLLFSFRLPVKKLRTVIGRQKYLFNGRISRKLELAAFIVAPLVIGLFLAYTSRSSTPLIKGFYGYDGSAYSFFGNAWARGQIPYLDFFCNKGPILYAIFLLGVCLGEQWGIFLLQCLAMWASLTAAYLIAKNLSGKRFAGILSVVGTLCFYCIVCDEGAIIEEFDLPLIYWSIFFIVKYFCALEKNGQQIEHPPKYALFYGVAFGYFLGMRISDGLYVCVFIFCIGVNLLIHKKFKNFLQNGIFFTCGTAVIVLPFILYFAHYNALPNLLQAYTVNAYYAGNGGDWPLDQLGRIVLYLTPVWMCIPIALEQKPVIRESIVFGGLSIMAFLYKSYLFPHYYVIVLPFVSIYFGLLMHRKSTIFAFDLGKEDSISIGEMIKRSIQFDRYSLIYLCLTIYVLFAVISVSYVQWGAIRYEIQVKQAWGDVNNPALDEPSRELLRGIAPEDQDSVVIFYNRYDYISLATGIYPNFRDFGGIQWVIDDYVMNRPGMEPHRELYENISFEKLPKYIVLSNNLYAMRSIPLDIIQEYVDSYYSLKKQVTIPEMGDFTMYLYEKG